jgi:transcriptional regulator with XRE-family HTH domain
MNQIQLAEKIRKLRNDRAWSQAQLAEVASLSIRTVQRVELNGKCSQETLLALASAFDINVEELTEHLVQVLKVHSKFSINIFGLKLDFDWFKSRTAFVLGLIIIFPAIYFISASVLKYNLGISVFFDPLEFFYSSSERLKYFNLISPLIFLSGLAGAFIVNLLVMLSIKLWREKGMIQSEISFSPKTLNLIISIASIATLLFIITYFFTESFVVR